MRWIWTTYGLLAGAVAACGADGGDPGTGLATTGSTSGSGGATGHGGSSNGGTGASSGEACVGCIDELATQCGDFVTACEQSEGCQDWLGCAESCALEGQAEECYLACDSAHLPSNSANQNLKSCVCEHCVSKCTAMCPCGRG
jgi:hypothetical protein